MDSKLFFVFLVENREEQWLAASSFSSTCNTVAPHLTAAAQQGTRAYYSARMCGLLLQISVSREDLRAWSKASSCSAAIDYLSFSLD